LSRGGRRGLCAACTRLQAFALRLIGDRSRAFRVERPRTVRSSVTACRHRRSVREPARSTSVRAAWNRGRWVVAVRFHPLRPISPLAHPFAFVGRRPVRLTCTSRSFRCMTRMLTPRAWCRPPHWRSLNQEVPTSDVPCRFSGTDHRLQPTHRCPTRACAFRRHVVRRIHLKSQHRLATLR
jgi:hypothetical protein